MTTRNLCPSILPSVTLEENASRADPLSFAPWTFYYRYWRVTGVCMLSTKQFRSAEDVTTTVFSAGKFWPSHL